jgi:hypothetical protein
VIVSYLVHLAYFRPSGRFLAYATTVIDREALSDIWDEIVERRRIGELPGLRPKAGRDLFILVDVMSHPKRRLHLIVPPCVGDEDVTLVHVRAADAPSRGRTTTDDVVDTNDIPVDDATPVDATPVDAAPVDAAPVDAAPEARQRALKRASGL